MFTLRSLTAGRINKMMIIELLAGGFRTLVVSMLSERVMVMVMLAEWASAKSSTSIDDKIVS